MSKKQCKFCNSERLVHTSEGFCYFNGQLTPNPKLKDGYASDYRVYSCIDCGRNTVFAFLKGERLRIE